MTPLMLLQETKIGENGVRHMIQLIGYAHVGQQSLYYWEGPCLNPCQLSSKSEITSITVDFGVEFS